MRYTEDVITFLSAYLRELTLVMSGTEWSSLIRLSILLVESTLRDHKGKD